MSNLSKYLVPVFVWLVISDVCASALTDSNLLILYLV